jgi:hypothetical protein
MFTFIAKLRIFSILKKLLTLIFSIFLFFAVNFFLDVLKRMCIFEKLNSGFIIKFVLFKLSGFRYVGILFAAD